MRLLPDDYFYADQLTGSARTLLRRFAAACGALVLALVAVVLVLRENWREVLAGALAAWSVTIMAWARSSYRRERDLTMTDLKRVAEVDLLHARLNQLAKRVGAPLIGLETEIEHVTQARMMRLAHGAGLDEFRQYIHADEAAYRFWDGEALGYHD